MVLRLLYVCQLEKCIHGSHPAASAIFDVPDTHEDLLTIIKIECSKFIRETGSASPITKIDCSFAEAAQLDRLIVAASEARDEYFGFRNFCGTPVRIA